MVITTRRIDELQEQCRSMGISFLPTDGREALMDRLRSAMGHYDPGIELDPMKCYDLKKEIAWGTEDPFKGIARYLTDRWVAEPKLDGCRLRMFLGKEHNTLNSGRRSVQTFRYTDRTENFQHLKHAAVPELDGTILDGELLAPTGKIQTHTGTWTNSLLNASVALTNSNPIGSQQTQARFGKAQFWVFDVMFLRGEDITGWTYDQRRKALEMVVGHLQSRHPECEIKLVPQYEATPDVVQQSIESGFEGVVLKSRIGTYQLGKRSKNWLKVKTFSTADSFVVGWSPGENANTGMVGSLDLGVYLPDGSVRPVAQVGNLIHEWRREISAPDGSLKPEYYGLVIEWMAQGLGKNGRARHAHMLRIRPDKTPQDCLVDQLDIFPNV